MKALQSVAKGYKGDREPAPKHSIKGNAASVKPMGMAESY
jgi:hypothetical protein